MRKAIVTDLVLQEVEALFERNVVTPSTLFAANSLAQAVILHDQVFLGMIGTVGGSPSGGLFVESKFRDLHLGDASPRRPVVIEPEFEISKDSPYYKVPIETWLAPRNILNLHSIETEINHLELVLDFLRARRPSDITADTALFDSFGVQEGYGRSTADKIKFSKFNEDVRKAGGRDISPTDLTTIRDMAWMAAAGSIVAHEHNYEVYHSLIERPLYAGQLLEAGGPLALVKKMEEANQPPVFWAREMVLPPFFGMIISDQNFNANDFWSLLWQMRDRHEDFRTAITKYETAIQVATTQGELNAILADHQESWDTLLALRKNVADRRILYTVADAVISAGSSFMKYAQTKNTENIKISRTGGLVRLWDDIGAIAPATKVPELLRQHFNSVPDALAWKELHSLVKKINSTAGLQEGNRLVAV